MQEKFEKNTSFAEIPGGRGRVHKDPLPQGYLDFKRAQPL